MEEGLRLRLWQGVVFAILWFAYGSTYLLRKPIGVIKADIQLDLGVSEGGLGWMDTALLLPYAGVSLFLGSIGDRLGPRITLGGGLIIASASMVFMAMCRSYNFLLVLLAVSGASQSLCWPACCAFLGRWFSDASRNTAFGMFGTCCFVFGVGGTGLAVYLLDNHGWRFVFVPPAMCVAVLGLVVFGVARDPKECGFIMPGRVADGRQGAGTEVSMSIFDVWRVPLVLEVSLAIFCVKCVRYSLMFWLPLYMLRSLKYSQIAAGLASTSFELGGVLGSALVGMVVDRWMDGDAVLTSAVAISGSVMALLAFVMMASWGSFFHVLLLALAGAFNCGSDILLAGSVATDIGERVGRASAVTGVVNGMGSLGTVIEGLLVGTVATALGWGAMIPLMVILSVLGAMAAFRANTTKARSQGWVKISSVEIA